MNNSYHYSPHSLRFVYGTLLTAAISIVAFVAYVAISSWGLMVPLVIAGAFIVGCAVYCVGWIFTGTVGHEKVDRWTWRVMP